MFSCANLQILNASDSAGTPLLGEENYDQHKKYGTNLDTANALTDEILKKTATSQSITGSLPIATDIKGSTLRYRLNTGPANGTLTYDQPTIGACTYTYIRNSGFTGDDSFMFDLPDVGASKPANIIVMVKSENPIYAPPVAQNMTVSGIEDSPIRIAFVATGGDGGKLTYSIVTKPKYGIVTKSAESAASENEYVYKANSYDYRRIDEFTYSIADRKENTSTATVNVEIAPISGFKAFRRSLLHPIWGFYHYLDALLVWFRSY